MNRHLILLVLISALLAVSGCGKKEEAAPAAAAAEAAALTPEETAQIEAQYSPPPAPSGPSGPSAPAPKNQDPAPPIVQRLQGAVHNPLTLQLRMYIERTGQMPASLAEFVNSAMDSVPPAPPGMKFVLDPADKTVKVVRK
jgi:hypothetical protein